MPRVRPRGAVAVRPGLSRLAEPKPACPALERRPGKPPRRLPCGLIDPLWGEPGYTAEQAEFLKAMDRLRRRRRYLKRPGPLWPAVLALAKALGYRKVLPSEVDP